MTLNQIRPVSDLQDLPWPLKPTPEHIAELEAHITQAIREQSELNRRKYEREYRDFSEYITEHKQLLAELREKHQTLVAAEVTRLTPPPVHKVHAPNIFPPKTPPVGLPSPSVAQLSPTVGELSDGVGEVSRTVGNLSATVAPTPPPNPDLALLAKDPEAREISTTLQDRLHKRSPLDQLPEDHQTIIYDLLTDYSAPKVVLTLAMAPPHGLNLKTNERSLQRFRKRAQKRHAETVESEKKKIAEGWVKDHDPQTAALKILRLKLLDYAVGDANLNTLEQMVKVLATLHTQTIADRKQTLAETKQ